MEWITIVTMLALIELAVFGSMAGRARAKYGVQAPATTGNEIFERYYRVHYNTIEQLILFIPGLWAFGYYVSQPWAAGIGGVFILGRLVYAVSYVRAPETRGLGMLASLLPCWVLVIGGLVGAVLRVI